MDRCPVGKFTRKLLCQQGHRCFECRREHAGFLSKRCHRRQPLLYTTAFWTGTEPQPFPAPINTSANETHASFSLDGDRIYFTSDRAGGYGGRDIYVSHLLPDGNWGEPLNMGPNINTPLDEHSPYLHPDGQTLYFSS